MMLVIPSGAKRTPLRPTADPGASPPQAPRLRADTPLSCSNLLPETKKKLDSLALPPGAARAVGFTAASDNHPDAQYLWWVANILDEHPPTQEEYRLSEGRTARACPQSHANIDAGEKMALQAAAGVAGSGWSGPTASV